MDASEKEVRIVQDHFESKGYRVHSGLQFGCELVLYADDPENVHSDFCIHIVRTGKFLCSDPIRVHTALLTNIGSS